jgi:hypothetical protein
VFLNPGEQIQFTWRLLSNSNTGLDRAYVSVDGSLETVGLQTATTSGAPYGFAFSTAPQTYTTGVFAGLPASVTVFFGLVDVNDFVTSSALVLDSVQVIPEPGSYAAAVAGAALALVLLRRRRS